MTYLRTNLKKVGVLQALLCAGVLLLKSGALAHPPDAGKGQTGTGGIRTADEKILDQVGFDQKLDNQVPLDLNFRDESGKPVQLQQYFGTTPVIILPIYYRCGMLCPLGAEEMLRSLQQIKPTIGRDFQIVTLSIDPKETPEMATETKKGYIAQYKRDTASAEVGWHFLTGQHEAIDKLCNAIGFRYAYSAKTGEYAHPDGIVVVTPEGKVSRYFYRLDYPPRDVQFGLMDASKERIGSPLAYIALSCFHYNPETGKYNVSVMKVLRLFSAVFVVLCFSVIAIAVGREKRARRAVSRDAEKENHSEVLPIAK
jgi:protein SCO1/2